MVEIAFYIASKGRLTDKLMALFQLSEHSHVEMVLGSQCFSSSGRDGGVRRKKIDLSSGKWVVFKITDSKEAEQKLYQFFLKTENSKYDYVGAVLNLCMRIYIQLFPSRYNCVEWAIMCINYILGKDYSVNITMNELVKVAEQKDKQCPENS